LQFHNIQFAGETAVGGGIIKKFHVRILGTRFEARNCISEPGPQEPYSNLKKKIYRVAQYNNVPARPIGIRINNVVSYFGPHLQELNWVGHFYWANTKLEAVECVPLPLSSV
jgi:hypothetical protein